MDISDRRLILVSNVEPYAHHWDEGEIVSEKLAGGLTYTLNHLIQKSGGVWIAWGRGEADFEVLNSGGKIEVPDEKTGYELKRLDLSEEEIKGFYLGFSNELLWPICHSFPERATLEDYHSSEKKWKTYRSVNQRYADAALEEYEDNDLIWVHDYHMALVPRMISDERPEANIAFFWHIPWPAWETFGNLPWREEIMDGLLGSDFIGFHTPPLRENFLSCAKRLGKKVGNKNSTVESNGETTTVTSVPLGTDYEWYSSMAKTEKIKNQARELRKSIPAKKIILGVDRLDYIKGIPERLRAFELFLEEYPKFQGEVTLVQRIPPSRTGADEYQSILEKIHMITGGINERYEKAGWTPVKSFHRFLPDQEQLIPYYLAADVALVTPLADGMNLVSKEYVASVEDGVLILSEFAGAAEELGEAIHVNPYNSREVAQGIKRALTMSGEERKNRLKKLKERVKEKDLQWWRRKFLKEWQEAKENPQT